MLRTTSLLILTFFDEDLCEIYLKFVAKTKNIGRSSSFGPELLTQNNSNGSNAALLPHPAKYLFITVQTYTGSSYQLVIV